MNAAYTLPLDIWFMLDDEINNGHYDVTAAELVCQYGLPDESLQVIRDEFGIE